MDYAVALLVYIASIVGVFYSMAGMIAFKNDKAMVNLMVLCSIVFCGTTYIGGMMLKAIA